MPSKSVHNNSTVVMNKYQNIYSLISINLGNKGGFFPLMTSGFINDSIRIKDESFKK